MKSILPAGTRRTVLAIPAGAALGYLIGSFPSADLAARAATRGRVDLRERGSGNPGATNAAAVLGKRWGAIVLVSDIAKGALAGFVARRLGGDNAAYAAATGAIAGHIYPMWSRLRGGKGISTSVGSCLAVFPAYVPIDAVVSASSLVGSRKALPTIVASSVVWTAAAIVWWKKDLPNGWGPAPSGGLAVFAAVSSALIVAKSWSAERSRRREATDVPSR